MNGTFQSVGLSRTPRNLRSWSKPRNVLELFVWGAVDLASELCTILMEAVFHNTVALKEWRRLAQFPCPPLTQPVTFRD